MLQNFFRKNDAAEDSREPAWPGRLAVRMDKLEEKMTGLLMEISGQLQSGQERQNGQERIFSEDTRERSCRLLAEKADTLLTLLQMRQEGQRQGGFELEMELAVSMRRIAGDDTSAG